MGLDSNDLLLGRIAVHAKLISVEQLNEATLAQGRSGARMRLGEILVDKGFVTPAQLQKLLAAQRQVTAKHAAKKATDALVPEPEAGAAEASVPARPAKPKAAARPAPKAAPAPGPATSPDAARDALGEILREAVAAGASDVHLHSGVPLRWRLHGVLGERGEGGIAPQRAEALLRSVLSEEQAAALDADGQVDFALPLAGTGRFRVNVYRQQRGLDAVFRASPDHPPSLEELGLPNSLARLTNYHQGLVLVTGPAGCGKSSTMAALLNLVNEERSEHILTIEDPIEYVHASRQCLVNQRQVRRHTESFARALRAGLREDPDVIAIGELRDLETIALALTAAETGHFVLATLHTSSTIRTIDRLIGVFPPDQQGQVRTMLSESLRAVVSQRLVPRADGKGRVAALEVLVANKAVGNLIRENKSFQIRSILQTGGAQGMCLLDASLEELLKAGTIQIDEARRHCEEPKRFGGPAV